MRDCGLPDATAARHASGGIRPDAVRRRSGLDATGLSAYSMDPSVR
jgi:hypothetical protein